jgi:hypothetical protein
MITYRNDCAKIVYESLHKSRYDVQWEPAMLSRVQDKIDGCSFLEGFSYTER